jgi:hypothetical protein
MAQKPEIDLAPIWADATPLIKFLEGRRSQAQNTSWGSTDQDPDLSSIVQGLAQAMQQLSSVPLQFNIAKEQISNDMVAGRISAIGRRSKSRRFVILDSSYWIGANVDWGDNSLTLGRVVYVDIRVVDQQLSSLPGAEPTAEFQGTSDVVKAAIANYSAEDPDLKAKPDIRFRAYRKYVRDKGFDPHKRGFSTKTFEACETKFRNKNNGK